MCINCRPCWPAPVRFRPKAEAEPPISQAKDIEVNNEDDIIIDGNKYDDDLLKRLRYVQRRLAFQEAIAIKVNEVKVKAAVVAKAAVVPGVTIVPKRSSGSR